jgi:Ni,Fe-hydrogenase I small subunit
VLELDNTFDDLVNPTLRYAETDEEIVKRVRYTRCPHCGAKIQAQIPCFACALQEQLKQKRDFYRQRLDENDNEHNTTDGTTGQISVS